MDLGTVIGFVMILGLLAGAMSMGVGVGAYIDLPSFLIVFGGTAGALLIAFKMEQMKKFGTVFMIAVKPQQQDYNAMIEKLVEYATNARRDGILALEGAVNDEPDKFLKNGLQMAVDGHEPDTIRELLEIEMDQTSARHKANAAMFDQLGGFSGAMGMVGTLIGLVAMLLNMADPSAIGPAMAIALLTTMYGAILGNTVGAPIGNLLSIRNNDETLNKELILEGIMSIQAGDNPRTLEDKLNAFLPPSERKSAFA